MNNIYEIIPSCEVCPFRRLSRQDARTDICGRGGFVVAPSKADPRPPPECPLRRAAVEVRLSDVVK